MKKYNEKKDFFVVCDKCNKKVFEHKGFIEHPKGRYTFMVECDCGYEFNHVFVTFQERQRSHMEKMSQQLSPEYISNIAKTIKKRMVDEDGESL